MKTELNYFVKLQDKCRGFLSKWPEGLRRSVHVSSSSLATDLCCMSLQSSFPVSILMRQKISQNTCTNITSAAQLKDEAQLSLAKLEMLAESVNAHLYNSINMRRFEKCQKSIQFVFDKVMHVV